MGTSAQEEGRLIWRNEQEIQIPMSRASISMTAAKRLAREKPSLKHVAAFLMKGNTPVFSLG
jgi:hypothetical protein